VAAHLQTKPVDLGCESVGRLHITIVNIVITTQYSARKLMLTLPSYEAWKAESTLALQ